MIYFMPKKKKLPVPSIPEAQGQKKYVRSRDLGDVVYIGAEVQPEIAKAIHDYCETNGIKKRFVIESALKEWLRVKGLLVKS